MVPDPGRGHSFRCIKIYETIRKRAGTHLQMTDKICLPNEILPNRLLEKRTIYYKPLNALDFRLKTGQPKTVIQNCER